MATEDKQTPSSVGDIEAAVPISIPETAAPLSVRIDNDTVAHSHTAVHHAHSEPLLQPSHMVYADQSSLQTIQPSALTVENVESSTFGSIRLGPNEFAVTLPMDSRLKDDYERRLTKGAPDMQSLLASFDPSKQIPQHEVIRVLTSFMSPVWSDMFAQRSSLLSKAQELTHELNNVSIHPDLNYPQYLNEHELDMVSSWAEYSSAKFSFLKYWIELASSTDIHVILAVQGEMQQALVERYLLGKGFSYTRSREELGANLEVSLIKGSLSFGVHNFGIHSRDRVREVFRPPSAFFVLDASFDPKSPSAQHIRTTYTRNGGLLPVIWLLISNSCEHIGCCLPDMPEPDRMRLLLHETARLHEDVGDLQEGFLGVWENAKEIRDYLSDSFASWPLASIEPLRFPSFHLPESSPSPEEQLPGTLKRELVRPQIGFSTVPR